jgi:hypothetical protein
MQASHPLRLALRLCAVGAALFLAARLRAEEPSFSAGLSSEELAASGVSHLTATQAAILDALVSQDVTAARQGGVTGFSTGFSARHWAHERVASGLDQLSAAERAVLDRLTARAIALGPPPDDGFTYSPPKSAPAPAIIAPPKPTPSESLVTAVEKLEVHGDLSFTVGAGSHGSSFYGTSDDLYVTDPSGKFTLAVGIDDYRGKGPIGPLFGPFGPDCAVSPLLYGVPGYWNW